MAKVYSTEYSRYTDQYKQLAVLLSYHPDMLAIELAEKLGIHPIMLYRWRLEVKQKKIKGKAKQKDFQSETDLLKANQRIKALEKELQETQQERDFLKKVKRFSQALNTKSSRS